VLDIDYQIDRTKYQLYATKNIAYNVILLVAHKSHFVIKFNGESWTHNSNWPCICTYSDIDSRIQNPI
jgi:hypothetical protein